MMYDYSKSQLAEVDIKDIVEFFQEKAPDARCGVCNKEDFAYMLSNEYLFCIPSMPLIEEDHIEQGGIPVALAFCRNCGNFRSHFISVIYQWKLIKEQNK